MEPGPYFIRIENVAIGDPTVVDTAALDRHYSCEVEVTDP
jgi:hypothetical protein